MTFVMAGAPVVDTTLTKSEKNPEEKHALPEVSAPKLTTLRPRTPRHFIVNIKYGVNGVEPEALGLKETEHHVLSDELIDVEDWAESVIAPHKQHYANVGIRLYYEIDELVWEDDKRM